MPKHATRRADALILSHGTRISPVLTLIAFTIFLPDELSFYILQFRLTPIRFLLFLLTPFLVFRFCQTLISGRRRLVFSDIFVLLTGVWMIVAPAIVVDLGYSLHHSAPSAVEFCGSYFAPRLLLSKHGQSLQFADLLCHVIAVVAVLGALDAIVGRPVTHDFFHQLFGLPLDPVEYRLGIIRARGPIEHPILFGIVCAVGFLIALSSSANAKALTATACGLGALLSLSSAPIEGAFLGLALHAYESVFNSFRHRWSLLLVFGALLVGGIYAVTEAPLAFIFGHLDIDPASYWIRLFQWNTVGTVVMAHPWFGIAFQWPEMVRHLPFYAMTSVDSLWLLLSLVYGIPGAVFVGLSMIGINFYPTSGHKVHLTKEAAKLGRTLSIVIVVLVLLGFTVDIWEATWMLAGLVVGLRAHLVELGSRAWPGFQPEAV